MPGIVFILPSTWLSIELKGENNFILEIWRHYFTVLVSSVENPMSCRVLFSVFDFFGLLLLFCFHFFP